MNKLKILDHLIAELTAYRNRLKLRQQIKDLSALEGVENPADAGFSKIGPLGPYPTDKGPYFHLNVVGGRGGQEADIKMPIGGFKPIEQEATIYFPGFTQKEIEKLVEDRRRRQMEAIKNFDVNKPEDFLKTDCQFKRDSNAAKNANHVQQTKE